MLDKRLIQGQDVANGSTAIQAGGDIVISTGLGYADVREIVLDLFKSNFLQLAGDAKEVARQRAEEITDKFLQKLSQENAAGLSQAATPDFQYGLFTAQKEFARTADANLADLLVDLLVDRTKHPSRDMVQIVLNECLSVAPKLTDEQLSALAIIFFIKYCSTKGVVTFDQFGAHLDKFIAPFVKSLPKTTVAFQHLQFAGCGSIQLTSVGLEDVMWQHYQGLFTRGFDASDLSGCTFYFNQNQQLTAPSAVDTTKLQVRAQNLDHLEALMQAHRVSLPDAQRLRESFGKNRLSPEEIKSKCIEVRPYMADLFSLWTTIDFHSFTLTSVGIALGHANIKRLTGEFADLAIWVH